MIDFHNPRELSLLKRRLGIVLGMIMGGLAGILGWAFWQGRGQRLPRLTPDAFRQAKSLWERQEINNYRVVVEVSGRQAARYEVQVKDGVAVRVLHNGQPLSLSRLIATWSVPGMFGTIQSDLDRLPRRKNLTLWARFHPVYGYPESYRRLETVVRGESSAASWRVVEFEIRPSTAAPPASPSRADPRPGP